MARHNDEVDNLQTAYADAVKTFKRAEAELDKALDALAAARAADSPSAITRTRLAAVEADRAAGAAWDSVEYARRAFWRQRAAECERKVVADCVPLLVQLTACQRFAGLPAIPPEHVLRHHLIAPQAHVELSADVSIEPLPAPSLDRADDEIIAWQPPLRSCFSRSGRRIK